MQFFKVIKTSCILPRRGKRRILLNCCAIAMKRPSEKGGANRSDSLKNKGQKEKIVGNTAMVDAFARLQR
ncbi:hypothetical protein [Neisseria sp.]|uniref:hypothetical protein n=1 Tax=Neisseria sp. TaxID=192066 RepID=UPI0035A0BAE7